MWTIKLLGGTYDGMSLDVPLDENLELRDEYHLPCRNEPAAFSYRGNADNDTQPIERYIRMSTFVYCIDGFFN